MRVNGVYGVIEKCIETPAPLIIFKIASDFIVMLMSLSRLDQPNRYEKARFDLREEIASRGWIAHFCLATFYAL